MQAFDRCRHACAGCFLIPVHNGLGLFVTPDFVDSFADHFFLGHLVPFRASCAENLVFAFKAPQSDGAGDVIQHGLHQRFALEQLTLRNSQISQVQGYRDHASFLTIELDNGGGTYPHRFFRPVDWLMFGNGNRLTRWQGKRLLQKILKRFGCAGWKRFGDGLAD